jgi:ACR3 family arsenite efflux pump ArsB
MVGDRTMVVSSLILNWLIGPAALFAFAWPIIVDSSAMTSREGTYGLAGNYER